MTPLAAFPLQSVATTKDPLPPPINFFSKSAMGSQVHPAMLRHEKLLNLTAENITENTLAVNSKNPDLRLKYLFERLVIHLHDFVRETRLSTSEWQTAIEFLTKVGQTCTNVRQEFILLSDILGVSLLVDAVNHPKPRNATEGTVLGPFHTHESQHVQAGSKIADDPEGLPLIVICTIRDTADCPIPGVMVDIWETDSSGNYDVQHDDYSGPNCRGVLESDQDGVFWFKAIVPVSYPIPYDGPVGQLLQKLYRHQYRPAHIHFMFEKPNYDKLITALYLREDPYIFSDSVFGVKDSLIVDMTNVDADTADKYGVQTDEYRMIKYDFTLVTEKEARDLRNEQSMESLKKLGLKCRLLDGLPIPELD